MDKEQRMAELLELRTKGHISDTEMKELGEIQAELKENPTVSVSKKELSDMLMKANEEATTKNKEAFDALEKSFTDFRAQALRKDFDSTSSEKTLSVKKEMGSIFKAILSNDKSKAKELIVASKFLNESTDADGGFLLNDEFETSLIYQPDSHGIFRRDANRVNMGTLNSKRPIGINSVITYFIGEAGIKLTSAPTFGQRLLKAKKLAAIIPWTEEIAEDSELDLFNIIVAFATEKFAETEDLCGFQGNGLSNDLEILGIFGTAGVGTVDGGSTTVAACIDHDFLIDIIRNADSRYKTGAPKFYLHETVIAIIEKLKDSEGRPLYRTLGDSATGRLLGYQVEITNSMPDVTTVDAGSAGDPFIVFGDLRFTSFGLRRDITTKLLTEASIRNVADDGDLNLATQDMQALRLVERFDITVDTPEALTVGERA